MSTTRNISDDSTLSYLFRASDKKAEASAKENADAIKALRKELVNLIYPVGSIYMSVNSASPQVFLGGTWERITGRFLLAATDNGSNGGNNSASIKPGYTGGEATHTLTTTEMPRHTHPLHGWLFNGGASTQGWKYGIGYQHNTGEARTLTDLENTSQVPWGNEYTGGGIAHNTMPPYLAVYVWKRTA